MIVKGGGAAASIILIIVQGGRGLKLRDVIKERAHKITSSAPHEMRKAIFFVKFCSGANYCYSSSHLTHLVVSGIAKSLASGIGCSQIKQVPNSGSSIFFNARSSLFSLTLAARNSRSSALFIFIISLRLNLPPGPSGESRFADSSITATSFFNVLISVEIFFASLCLSCFVIS